MQLDLDDEEIRALLNVLTEAIDADPFPLLLRILLLRGILTKLDAMGPAPPPATQKPRISPAAARTSAGGSRSGRPRDIRRRMPGSYTGRGGRNAEFLSSLKAHLANNDAHPVFARLGDLVVTGRPAPMSTISEPS
jgi:hypothetical protein